MYPLLLQPEFCSTWFARALNDNAPLVLLAAIAVAFPYGKACYQVTVSLPYFLPLVPPASLLCSRELTCPAHTLPFFTLQYIHKHATSHGLTELAALAREILPLGTGKTGEVEPNRLHTWFFSRVNRRGTVRGYGLVGSRKQAKEPHGHLTLASSAGAGEVVKAFIKAEGFVHFRYDHPGRPDGGDEGLSGSISSGSGNSLSTLSTASSSSLTSFANFDYNHTVQINSSSNDADSAASTFPYVPSKTSLSIRPDSSSPLPIGFLPSFISSDSSFAILAHAHVHDGPFLICTDLDHPAELPIADDDYSLAVVASVERVNTWLGSMVHGEVEIEILPRLTDEEEVKAEVEAEENEEMRAWRWAVAEEERRERKRLGWKMREFAKERTGKVLGVFGKRSKTLD